METSPLLSQCFCSPFSEIYMFNFSHRSRMTLCEVFVTDRGMRIVKFSFFWLVNDKTRFWWRLRFPYPVFPRVSNRNPPVASVATIQSSTRHDLLGAPGASLATSFFIKVDFWHLCTDPAELSIAKQDTLSTFPFFLLVRFNPERVFALRFLQVEFG